jgi:hypothetical protein
MVVGTKISQMDPLATLAAGDVAPVVRGTFNYKFDLGAKITSIDSVKANLSDLAASSGSSLVGFLQSGTGAVARTVQDKFRDLYSVFDIIPEAQHAAIVARTSTYDATADIKQAITNAVALRKTLYVPAGLYKIVPATSIALEGGAETCAFVMASYMAIEAEEGATFRLADSQSTDGTPRALNMFATNGTLTNVTIRGLTMDMNGANNKISPSRPVTYDVSKNMAMIAVSGTPAGVAARIDDCLIENCTFMNTPGVCCIVVAQSNTAATTLGQRWTIRNNLFLNNGTDTADHTSVFAWADSVLCEGNTFWNDTQYATVGKTGGVTAYEIHGSKHRFIGNRVHNYYRGMWVSSNLTSVVEGSVIEANNFDTMYYGIDFFRTTSSLTTTRDTLIAGNTFHFDGSLWSAGPSQKAAINIACSYAISDILITDNVLRSTDILTASGTAFVVISPGTVAANTYKNITIRNNQQFGGTNGVQVVTNATNGLGYLCIEGNRWIDLSNAAVSTAPIGVFVNGVSAVTTLSLQRNICTDSRGGSAQCDYGLYLQGTVTNLFIGQNFAQGMVTANIDQSSLTATNRTGSEVGWTTGTGSANKGAFSAYAGATVSAAYVQAEAQATNDAAKNASQRVKALEDAIRIAGLIN